MTSYLDTAPQFIDDATVAWVKKLMIDGEPAIDYLTKFAAQNIPEDVRDNWVKSTHISIGRQARHITQTGQRWLRLKSSYGNPGYVDAKVVNYEFGVIRSEQESASRKPKSFEKMGILAIAEITVDHQ